MKMRKFTRDEGGSFEYRLPKMGELVQIQEAVEGGTLGGFSPSFPACLTLNARWIGKPLLLT